MELVHRYGRFDFPPGSASFSLIAYSSIRAPMRSCASAKLRALVFAIPLRKPCCHDACPGRRVTRPMVRPDKMTWSFHISQKRTPRGDNRIMTTSISYGHVCLAIVIQPFPTLKFLRQSQVAFSAL